MNKKLILKAFSMFRKGNPLIESLNHIRITSDKFAELTDIEVEVRIPFQSHGINGCIDNRQLSEILKLMALPEVVLDGRKVTFTEGNNKVELALQDESTFPVLQSNSEGRTESVIGTIPSEYAKYLKSSLVFASQDDMRPMMTKIQVGKHIVATDAHRLVFVPLPLANQLSSDVCLPQKMVKLMLVFGGDWEVKIIITEGGRKMISVTNQDKVVIASRESDGKYPQWESAVPQVDEKTPVAVFNKRELIHALKIGTQFSNTVTHQCIIDMNGKVAKITSQDMDYQSKYEGLLSTAIFTEDIVIGVNGRLMLDILDRCEENEITIHYFSPSRAMVVNKVFLIMPLMIGL